MESMNDNHLNIINDDELEGLSSGININMNDFMSKVNNIFKIGNDILDNYNQNNKTGDNKSTT